MALMELAIRRLLLHALVRLLKPGGRVVFSLLQPCFHLHGTRLGLEVDDREGQLVEPYACARRAFGVYC